MKIVENTQAFPPYKHFTDVEEKFLNFEPNCRVLTARHSDDPSILFTLKKRHEPGSPGFPQGGFEVFGPDGGVFNFMLDEVMVHPFHLGMRKFFSKQENITKEKVTDPNKPKGRRGRPKIDPSLKKTLPTYQSTGGKRGRPKLDPAMKAAKEAAKLERRNRTGGRKGRPKKQVS